PSPLLGTRGAASQTYSLPSSFPSHNPPATLLRAPSCVFAEKVRKPRTHSVLPERERQQQVPGVPARVAEGESGPDPVFQGRTERRDRRAGRGAAPSQLQGWWQGRPTECSGKPRSSPGRRGFRLQLAL